MALSDGSRLGPYEVISRLGAGGMGEVYRARDPRLGRDVAIKLLPDAFAADPERLARFEREAKLLASLQHSNIAVLHGLEEADGRRFLVMQCVEGESLAQRLQRGPLPLPDALEIAGAIAAGLEAAHEGGVIHRDLKPGNVMVTPGGEVKVLDFGLAKAGAGGSASDVGLSASPTMTYAHTNAGVILGTAAYMSPEQARGKPVDRRTDIWSFGCVLYELLTGKQAFAGETVSDIVARILQTEPDWDALPAGTPARVRDLLVRCLQKDARRRLRDIGDARIEIEDLIAGRVSASGAHLVPTVTAARPNRWLVPALGVLVVVAAIASWFAALAFTPAGPDEPSRFEIEGPRGHTISSDGSQAQISPDGRTVAIMASDSAGTSHLWVRRLDALEPRMLPGTDDVTLMCWSPDSRSLAFAAGDRQLSRIAVAGGEPQPICAVKSARGVSWGPNGTLLVAPYSNGGIYRVAASGGDLVPVLRPDSAQGETGLRFPQFLPDGRHFLFSSLPPDSSNKGRVCVGSVDGGAPRVLLHAESGAFYAPPGWLLYGRGAALMAQRFDAGALKVTGDPVPLGDLASGVLFGGAPVVSAAQGGALAYVTLNPVKHRIAWLDAQGHETQATPAPTGFYYGPSLSPDGHRLLLGSSAPDQSFFIELLDLDRGVVSRVTPQGILASGGTWAPDGNSFACIEENVHEQLVIRSLVDDSRKVLLNGDPAFKRVYGWTPDGRTLLYGRLDSATKWDVWALPLDGSGPPRPLLHSTGNELNATLSPDGRWLAYTSDESGVNEVYVIPYGTPGMRYQVTSGGGGNPFWSRDGKRFAFGDVKRPTVVMAAPVHAGATFALGPVQPMMKIPDDIVGADFDRSMTHLLAILPAEKPRPQTVTLVQGWPAALRRP